MTHHEHLPLEGKRGAVMIGPMFEDVEATYPYYRLLEAGATVELIGIEGDATVKGVPAALVMSTTRSMLRALARASNSPGEVLEQVNDLLVTDIPPNMFVTCFYAILDPESGRLRYANAGHDLPYLHRGRV